MLSQNTGENLPKPTAPVFKSNRCITSAYRLHGSGIGGSSVTHFLRHYFHPTPSHPNPPSIYIFKHRSVVGGHMATVSIDGETFEAGASILHPKNYHVVNYSKLLGLKVNPPPASKDDNSISLRFWDGKKFVFKSLQMDSKIP